MNRTTENSYNDNCKTQVRSLIPLRMKNKNDNYKKQLYEDDRTRTKIPRLKAIWNPADPEPPAIPLDKMILLKKVQQEQLNISVAQHELLRRIEMIKEQLTEVKTKIEKITTGQQQMNERIEGCHDCVDAVNLVYQKSEEHRNLMKCIDKEEKLMEELQRAQREICEVGVAEQAFSLEMEKKIDGIYEMYHTRKEYLAKKRIRRERLNEKTARYAHRQTVREVINSLSQAKNASQRKPQSTRTLNIKSARNKTKRFFRKTVQERELQTHLQEAAREYKASNQQRLLTHLKTEMDRQKDILWAEHQLREKKRQRMKEAKEVLKQEMLRAGKNPYLYEKMVKSNEKDAKIKAKIEEEKEEIKKLSQRLTEINIAKEKEEMKKKKWDNIWARRLKEKKEKDMRKRKEMYGFVQEVKQGEHEIEVQEIPVEEEQIQEIPVEIVKPTFKKKKREKSFTNIQNANAAPAPDAEQFLESNRSEIPAQQIETKNNVDPAQPVAPRENSLPHDDVDEEETQQLADVASTHQIERISPGTEHEHHEKNTGKSVYSKQRKTIDGGQKIAETQENRKSPPDEHNSDDPSVRGEQNDRNKKRRKSAPQNGDVQERRPSAAGEHKDKGLSKYQKKKHSFVTNVGELEERHISPNDPAADEDEEETPLTGDHSGEDHKENPSSAEVSSSGGENREHPNSGEHGSGSENKETPNSDKHGSGSEGKETFSEEKKIKSKSTVKFLPELDTSRESKENETLSDETGIEADNEQTPVRWALEYHSDDYDTIVEIPLVKKSRAQPLRRDIQIRRPTNKLKKKRKQKSLIAAHAGGDSQLPTNKFLENLKKAEGPCFKCIPEVVSFSDFEVGKIYRKKVSVRNISYRRIGFTFLDFVDLNPPKRRLKSLGRISSAPSTASNFSKQSAHRSQSKNKILPKMSEQNFESNLPTYTPEPAIQDLVDIDFTAPEPIFPGLHHTFTVTFHPTELGNWNGKLKFEYYRGKFEIPIECLQKRFIPQLTPANVVFAKVVENTSAKIVVKIENLGAKYGSILYVKEHSEDQILKSPTVSLFGFSVPVSAKSSIFIKESSSHEHSAPATTPASTTKHAGAKSTTLLQRHNHDHDNSDTTHKDEHEHHERHESHDHDKDKDKDAHDTAHHKNHHAENAKHKVKHPHTVRHPYNHLAHAVAGSIMEELIRRVADPVFVAYTTSNKRSLGKGESRKINIHFRPPHIDTFRTTFEIGFEDPEEESVILKVEGHAVENPVVFDPMNTNMKICMIDHNYQQTISVSHPLKGCGKVTATVPAPLKHYVSVYPKEVSVFNYQPSNFSVKFHPTLKLLEDHDLSEYYDKSTGIIDFPVFFHLNFPIQLSSPIKTTFLAIVCDTRLQITPTAIDLGKCTSFETVKYDIAFYNPGIVPQHIGFVDLPEIFSFQPNYGITTILPNETRTIDMLVSVNENMSGDHTYHLKCQTTERREYIITVKIETKPTPIQLSRSRILFPVTCCGSAVTTALEVQSTNPVLKLGKAHSPLKFAHKFFFKMDDDVPIEIRPKAGIVECGESATIIVTYRAHIPKTEVQNQVIKLAERDFVAQQALFGLELQTVMNEIQFEMEMIVLREAERLRALEEEMNAQKHRSGSHISEINTGDGAEAAAGSEGEQLKSKSKREPSSIRGVSRMSKKGEKSEKKDKTNSKKDKSASKEKGSKGELAEPRKKSRAKSQTEEERKRSLIAASPQVAQLEHRRDELLQMLGQDFVPPVLEKINVSSPEYKRAEVELMRQLTPSARLYTVPCYIYDSHGNPDVLLLQVKCAMIRPDLVLINDSSVMDFGSVCLGDKIIREFKFANVSGRTLPLKIDIFNPYGPFRRCNALRKMEANDIYTLRVRYKPLEYAASEECVFIYGGDSKIELTLRGHSVIPQFYLNPLKNDIYIGKIQAQSVGSYQFEVINPSEANVTISLELGSIGPFLGKLPSTVIVEEISIHPGPGGAKENDPVDHVMPAHRQNTSTPPNTAETTLKNPPPPELANGKRRGSNSEGSGKADKGSDGKNKERRASNKNKNRSYNSKRRSTVTPDPIPAPETSADTEAPVPPKSPPPFVGPFEIVQNGVSKVLHLREMLEYLESEEQPVFFQAVPSKLTIKAMSTEKFVVYFIPVVPGRYFGRFKVILFGNVVHEFRVVGVATIMREFGYDSMGG